MHEQQRLCQELSGRLIPSISGEWNWKVLAQGIIPEIESKQSRISSMIAPQTLDEHYRSIQKRKMYK